MPPQGMNVPGTPSIGNRGQGISVPPVVVSAAPASVGLNMPTLAYNPSTVPGSLNTDYFAPSASDIAYVTARSNGPIRLAILWERAQPTLGGALDPTYMGYVDTIASNAATAGTTIFIDVHNYMSRLVSGTAHGVDNPDGVVTRAHLADLWTKIATRYATNAGVSGWDIMNEPTSNSSFGSTGNNATDLPVIMQAVVNAINAVETAKTIYVEGNGYSSAQNWVANNPGYPLTDTYNRIRYSGHCYPDYDGSGTHYTYASQLSNSIPDTVLADRTSGFISWLSSNSVKGHIGETAVGIDDTRWLNVADNGLAAWRAAGVPVSWWQYAPTSGGNPYDLSPYSGTQIATWAPIQKETGVGPMALRVSGPLSGTAGAASNFVLVKDGYVPSTVITPNDGGAGGTFSPASATISGYNQTQTFAYTQPGNVAATLTFGGPGLTAATASFTTLVVGPQAEVAAANDEGGGTSQTMSYTVGNNANRLLLVTITGRQAANCTGVTDNGVAMTLVKSTTNSGTCGVVVYQSLAPTSGAHTLVASYSAASYTSMTAQSFSNVNQTTPIEVSQTNGAYSASTSTSLTTLSANALIWEAINTSVSVSSSAATASPETSQIIHDMPSSTGSILVGTVIKSTAGAQTFGWSWTGSNSWGSVALSIKSA